MRLCGPSKTVLSQRLFSEAAQGSSPQSEPAGRGAYAYCRDNDAALTEREVRSLSPLIMTECFAAECTLQ